MALGWIRSLIYSPFDFGSVIYLTLYLVSAAMETISCILQIGRPLFVNHAFGCNTRYASSPSI